MLNQMLNEKYNYIEYMEEEDKNKGKHRKNQPVTKRSN